MNRLSIFNFIRYSILNTLFPIKCCNCQMKNQVLCENCINKIRLTEKIIDKNIVAIFDYQDPIIKKVIWELKYHHRRYLGEKLGQLLYKFSINEIVNLKTSIGDQPILIIPVPISIKKTKLRGYNQAKIIAQGFCHSDPKGIFELKDKIIFKKIETLPQAKIANRRKRLLNIKGVFEIKNPNPVKGQTIIIIDDVITTGGTINEIIKILKKAGAKKVIGLAVAH